LSEKNIDQMYKVFEKYYSEVSKEVFSSDLLKKDHVIILIDKKDQTIKGFSTILDYHFELGGKKVKGIFSGDTIIEKEFWGGSALQMAFIGYMFKEKLKKPLTPLYWFLISKGYKTYLLMANNFLNHYPRFEQETPKEHKSIMDSFASDMYGEAYDPASGLIKFDGIHDHLKGNVAPITEEMKRKSSRINFFEDQNPTWESGSELVCLAEFDLSLPIRFPLKTVRKSADRMNHKMNKSIKELLISMGVRQS
jgi:hypothetical protein